MWTMLAFTVLSLLPGQESQLSLANLRLTYGVPGIPRSANKVLPGDNLALAFDVEGMSVSPEGKFLYSVGLEVLDARGKVQFKQEPRDLEVMNVLGGKHLPTFASVDIGLDQPAGKYTVKLTVSDRTAKTSQSLSQDFEVLDREFGLVRLLTTADAEGRVPLGVLAEGAPLWIHFMAVEVAAHEKSHKGKLSIEARVLDEHNEPTRAEPFRGMVEHELPPGARALPVHFPVLLNRAGKFTAQIKATDEQSKKTATLTFPFTVVKAP